jgi:nicotinate phosphoribosyltransferase
MSFPSEQEAFDAYARAQPNNCILLVDTYDTLEGVRRAVETGRRLRENGHELAGIRLDSGDLAYLSLEARKILDAAGFEDAVIVASNDLDEHVIASLKEQGAAISVWGVGTRLVTGGDDPALGGVYKLGAVREPGGPWRHKVKVSEQSIKTTIPGIQQVCRFETDAGFLADVIYDEEQGLPEEPVLVDPLDATRRRRIAAGTPHVDLLEPALRSGRIVSETPPLAEVRERLTRQLERLHPGIKRFVNPHQYPVGLSAELHDLTTHLTLDTRGV